MTTPCGSCLVTYAVRGALPADLEACQNLTDTAGEVAA
jgi:hypothetical protein